MDILNDNLYATLMEIRGTCGIPKYVESATPLSKEAAAALPDTLFADRVNRRYPIDSKANTWLSAAYFAKTASGDNYSSGTMRDLVGSTIRYAAGKYGICDDVDKAMAALSAPVEKKASDDGCYGWPSEKRYPMFDEHGVKLACDYFSENCFNYPPKLRRDIASRILAKCAEYRLDAPETVRQEAGEGFSLRQDAAEEVLDRVKAVSRLDAKVACALGGALKAMLLAPFERYTSQVEKLASALDMVDAKFGFDDEYGTRFLSPMAIFHGRNVKEAQDVVQDTVELGPNHFSVKKLASLPAEVFTDALGDEFGKAVKTAGAVDASKLGPALKRLPGPGRGALYRSICVYMG